MAVSGDYTTWPQIAGALAHEGYGAKAIKAIGDDAEAQRQLRDILFQVEKRRRELEKPPALTWRHGPVNKPRGNR